MAEDLPKHITEPTDDSVEAWLRHASHRLKAAQIENPGLDTALLLTHVTGMDRAAIIARGRRRLGADDRTKLDQFLQRRLAHEPVSRILGSREFYGRPFQITPATLDPRPDSETLIDAALKQIDAEGWSNKEIRIIDIGTGSGCLLLTLLAELPQATGVGTDISSAALEVARENAVSLGLGERANFKQADLLLGINDMFNLAVSNPPYIPSGQINTLARDVFEYDPHLALDGGCDGLEVYRALARQICSVISNGWMFLEVGRGQAQEVATLLRGSIPNIGQEDSLIFHDLCGIERVVAMRARRRENLKL